MMKFLAMDFGGTFVKHCLMDEDAGIAERGEIPAPLGSSDQFVQVIVDLYEKYKGEIDGIAISMPGVIDSSTGHLYSAGAYTKAMGGKNLFELLEGKVDVQVAVENDAKAAVLAEKWKGSLKDSTDAAAIILGSGLGGGIIMDGKLRKGGHFASGEISGLFVTPGRYDFGNLAAGGASTSGLLSMVAAAKGMTPKQFEVSEFATVGAPDPDPNLPIYSGRDVFQWIDEGDPVTCEVYQKWLANLVWVIINMKMMLDPEKIVLGGGVSRNPRLLGDVRAEFEKFSPVMNAFGMPQTVIETCQYSADANLVGAVYNWLLLNK